MLIFLIPRSDFTQRALALSPGLLGVLLEYWLEELLLYWWCCSIPRHVVYKSIWVLQGQVHLAAAICGIPHGFGYCMFVRLLDILCAIPSGVA
ncbi:hypothetical protein U1Q18_027689 [Sarracenia purpurea var. burkii]